MKVIPKQILSRMFSQRNYNSSLILTDCSNGCSKKFSNRKEMPGTLNKRPAE